MIDSLWQINIFRKDGHKVNIDLVIIRLDRSNKESHM